MGEETLVQAVEGEVKKIEGEVVGEVKAAETEVKKFTTEVRVAVTADEALALAKMENEYLKAQMEIQRLTQMSNNIGQQFPSRVKALMEKYLIDPTTHVWDAVQSAFIKKT